MKQECSSVIKVIAKDTNNISYTVRSDLGGKAQLVRNLPCMQIFVILAVVSWQLTISSNISSKCRHSRPKHETKKGLVIYIEV